MKLSGEAFFTIVKDKTRPFNITARNSEVTVLGTSFNVRSYEDEALTAVSVATGKVRFAGRASDKTFKYVELNANEKGIYQHEKKDIQKLKDPTLNDSAWKTKKLVFVNSPVNEVFDAVAKYYNINIESSQSKALNCQLNASFDNQGLEDVMENVRISLGVKIEKTADATYSVTGGKSCPSNR